MFPNCSETSHGYPSLICTILLLYTTHTYMRVPGNSMVPSIDTPRNKCAYFRWFVCSQCHDKSVRPIGLHRWSTMNKKGTVAQFRCCESNPQRTSRAKTNTINRVHVSLWSISRALLLSRPYRHRRWTADQDWAAALGMARPPRVCPWSSPHQ